MNKSQLIRAISLSVNMTQEEATNTVNAILKSIESSLKKGEIVELIGFGTFFVRKRKARKAHNPKTLQPVRVPAKMVVKFKNGLYLKKALNSKRE